ncbi:MAG: VOC family protein, partial [Dehalococcoidia bacterium]|nr:VOC family protein [Dehalococcoidia bacterium]
MPPRLTEITTHVEDMASEAAFWEHGVGLPRLRPAPGEPLGRYAVFDLGGPRYELIADSPPRTKPTNKVEAGSAPVLLVPDVEAAVARAVAHGGRQIEPVRAIPPDAKAAFVCSPS